MTRTEFRFSGFGGQGVITMARVVGRAASIDAGMDATMTEAYGPEKTGGFSRGDVVVSDDDIDYPAVVDPDVVFAFSQDAFDRDASTVAEDGLVVVERDLVAAGDVEERRPDARIVTVPAVEIADDLDRRVVANAVALGAVIALVEEPAVDAVRSALREVVPEGTADLNERAFDRGRDAVANRREVRP